MNLEGSGPNFTESSLRIVRELAFQVKFWSGAGGRGMGVSTSGPAGDELAVALVSRAKEIASQTELWPGFDPNGIPLAFFDGKRTILFAHPHPPEGFQEARIGGVPAHVFDGRHSAVAGHSAVELGGVVTATLLLDRLPELGLDELAAIVIHEAFHVYQLQNPEVWPFGNEGDRLRYPVTDPGVMAQRLFEIRALRRAVESESFDDRVGWAKRAAQARRERFAMLEPAFVKYERETEMIEGMASYVEAAAVSRTQVRLDEAHVGDVRRTCYGAGHALGALLDALSPDWKAQINRRVYTWLDEALAAALDGYGRIPAREFSSAERSELLERGRAEAQRLSDERAEREAEFEARPGRRLIVIAGGSGPMRMNGMDPSNVRLAARRHGVIHTRVLFLRAGESRIEMYRDEGVDIEALTEGVGPSPLFDGIHRAVFSLREGDWRVSADGGTLKVNGGGIEAELQVSRWAEDGGRIEAVLV